MTSSPSEVGRITLERVTFRYLEQSKRPVLDEVSASFDRSRITVLTGPSGCGKSTLLYLGGGDLSPERRVPPGGHGAGGGTGARRPGAGGAVRPGGHAVSKPGAPVLYGHGGERAVLLSGEPAGAPGGDGGAAERRPGLLRHRPPAPPPPPLPVRRGEAAGRAGLSGRTAAGLDPAGRALRQFGRPNRRPSLRTARPAPPGMRHRHSGHRPPAGPLAVHRRRDPPHGPGRHAGRRRLCPQRPLPSGVGGAGRQRPRLPLPGRPAGQDRAGRRWCSPCGACGSPRMGARCCGT